MRAAALGAPAYTAQGGDGEGGGHLAPSGSTGGDTLEQPSTKSGFLFQLTTFFKELIWHFLLKSTHVGTSVGVCTRRCESVYFVKLMSFSPLRHLSPCS